MKIKIKGSLIITHPKLHSWCMEKGTPNQFRHRTIWGPREFDFFGRPEQRGKKPKPTYTVTDKLLCIRFMAQLILFLKPRALYDWQ